MIGLNLAQNIAARFSVDEPAQTPKPDEWFDCIEEYSSDADSTSTQPPEANLFAPPAAIGRKRSSRTSLTLGEVAVTPAELAAWHGALHREIERPIDKALAARVMDRIQQRIRSPAARPLTLAAKIERITDTDVRDFMRAAGLPAEDISRSRIQQARAAALASLSTLPAAFVGTCLSSCINAVFPNSDTARLIGFILNVAVLLATPYIHALFLQIFGAKADRMRARHYVVRVDRSKLHDRCSKPELVRELNARIAEFHIAEAAAHDIVRLHAAAAAIEALMPDIEAKQAADTRVYLDNGHQQLARYPKLVLAPIGQLLRAARWISAWASAGLQMGASLGTSALQAWLAGKDEYRKQQFTIKYRMLADAPLTASGHARVARGQPLRERHIDAQRLRGCFTGPEGARLAMLATCLKAQAGRDQMAFAGAVADGAGNTGNQEPGREIAALRADLARIESQRLVDLDLDGMAARLLQPGRWTDPLLWAEIAARLQKRGEMSTQFCKFLGQQWQLAIGPGYYVFVPKLLNVAAGGKPALPGMIACAGLAALLGLAGCKAHPEVAVERNEMQVRLDQGEAGTGFLAFVRNAGIALVALPRQMRQKRTFEQAIEAALDCLARHRLAAGSDEVFHDAVPA